jgi:hypothetical protein
VVVVTAGSYGTADQDDGPRRVLDAVLASTSLASAGASAPGGSP